MADRQWHTPAPLGGGPVSIPQQQENIPQDTPLIRYPQYLGKLESLRRLLQRHGNPQSTALGQYSTLELLSEVERQSGRHPTPYLAHPERHAYEMMAALATADDVRAWLAEWRHRGLDLGPFDKTDFFAVAPQNQPLTKIDHPLVVHQPDGMMRHLHPTAAGGNRGRPRFLANGLVDPYWGTGLDPAHVSGFVAPYRSTLKPYMACCGQEFGKNGEIPPGCWIAMGSGQTMGRLLRYEVWFQGLDSRTIWERVVDGTAEAQFVDAIQVGTAFLDRAYYSELDRQIRALVNVVVPAIVAVQLNALQSGFINTTASGLSSQVRAQICELVSLVDQYNGPQMGAGHLDTLCNDTFIANQICFLAAGQSEFAAGRLQQEIEVSPGVKLPKLYNMTGLTSLITRIKTINNPPADIGNLLEVLERVRFTYSNLKDYIFPGMREHLNVLARLTHEWDSFLITRLDFMQEEKKVAVETAIGAVETQLSTLPAVYNGWLADMTSNRLLFVERLDNLIDNLDAAVVSLPSKQELTTFFNALQSPSDKNIQIFINNPSMNVVGYGHLRDVKLYARFALAAFGMTNAILNTTQAVNAARAELERRARDAIDQAKRQEDAAAQARREAEAAAARARSQQMGSVAAQLKQIIADRYSAGSLTLDEQRARMRSLIAGETRKWEKIEHAFTVLTENDFLRIWTYDVPGRFFNKYIDRIEGTLSVVNQRAWKDEFDTDLVAVKAQLEEKVRNRGLWNYQPPVSVPSSLTQRLATQGSQPPNETLWARGFLFQQASCSYDSVFPALFKIPGQWLQHAIRNAKEIIPLTQGCTTNDALDLHEQISKEITYMEGRQGAVHSCIDLNKLWHKCIPTKDIGVDIEDDPRLMADALIHFYGLQRQFKRIDYKDYSNRFHLQDTELLLLDAGSMTGPFNQIQLHWPNTDYTLISCVAHASSSGGHWRSYVRHPKTTTWWVFDPFKLGTAFASSISAQSADLPPPIRQTVEGFVPLGWFYVRTDRLAGAQLTGRISSTVPLEVNIISITCPTSAQTDCGTLVLTELFKRNKRNVTYFEIRDKFRQWWEEFRSGIPFDDNTQIPDALFQRALRHFMPDHQVVQYYLISKPGPQRDVRFEVINPGKAPANTQLILLSSWERATATRQAGVGAGHYALLDTNRPATPDEIRASMEANAPPQKSLSVHAPTASGGGGSSVQQSSIDRSVFDQVAWKDLANYEAERKEWFVQQDSDNHTNIYYAIEWLGNVIIALKGRAIDILQDTTGSLDSELNKRPKQPRYFSFSDTPEAVVRDYGVLGFITALCTFETGILNVEPSLLRAPPSEDSLLYPLKAFRFALFPLLLSTNIMTNNTWTRASFADFSVQQSQQRWAKDRNGVAAVIIEIANFFISLVIPIADADGNFVAFSDQERYDFTLSYAYVLKETYK